MGLLEAMKNIAAENESLQYDILFVLEYFNLIDKRAREINPEELELPEEAVMILAAIAQRRGISDYSKLYFDFLQFTNTFMPSYGSLTDKQATLAQASMVVHLDHFTTLLACEQAKDFLRIYDASEALRWVEPEGSC